MNIVPIQEATANFIQRRQSKYASLRTTIVNVGEGQAVFIPFAEYSEKAVHQNVASLRKVRDGFKLSVRRHADGSGVFVFFTPVKG